MFNFNIDDNIYAHIKDNNRETLNDHIFKTELFFNKYEEEYNLKSKFKNLLKKIVFARGEKRLTLQNQEIDMLYKMFKCSIIYHDIGKMNLIFQKEKMNNNIYYNSNTLFNDSSHSKYSMIIYLNECFMYIKHNVSKENLIIAKYITLIFANSIYCHHGDIKDLKDTFNTGNIESIIQNINKYSILEYSNNITISSNVCKILNNIMRYEFNPYIGYILERLCSSLLISCDFLATSSFFNDTFVDDYKINKINNKEALLDKYLNSNISKSIINYSKNKNYFKDNNLPLINALRSEIAIETRENLLNNRDKYLFSLNAPTGSGKTFNSIGCSINLLNDNINKMLFVFPLNILSTQYTKELINMFNSEIEIAEINSITPMNDRYYTDGSVNYDLTLLDRQLLNYPIISTSNINLFNLLFSCNREHLMGFHSLFNSVIVLDEIQNYNNYIWSEMTNYLEILSEIMNIKIIFMSATLPDLNRFIDEDKIYSLLPNYKVYFNNSYFKDRVVIDKSLIHMKIDYSILENKIISAIKDRKSKLNCNNKVLVEFITRKRAVEFYEYLLSKKHDFQIIELDSLDNVINRQNIIDVINSDVEKDTILISTQVIEAGVDIDMDIGFKDISFPDLDEQFLGRINRNMKKKYCTAYFFNLDSVNLVYKGDYRRGYDISKSKYFDCLINKNFYEYYTDIISAIISDKSSGIFNDFDLISNNFKLLNNKFIESHMKLIDNNTIQIFIKGDYYISKYNANDVWCEYMKILHSDIKYSEKKILINKLMPIINLFTFNVIGNEIIGEIPIGGIYVLNDTSLLRNNKINIDLLKLNYKIV